MKYIIKSVVGANIFEAIIDDGVEEQFRVREALQAAIKRGADMTGADLRKADLRNIDLRGASLRGANLTDADLRGAKLTGADMRGVSLRNAGLTDAILRYTNLSGADLRGATLVDTDLRGINMTDANLARASMRGANLNSSNLLDIGTDSRGYRWVVRAGTPPRITAGCRWFTFAAAEDHWVNAHADDRKIHNECLTRLAACKASAKALGWI